MNWRESIHHEVVEANGPVTVFWGLSLGITFVLIVLKCVGLSELPWTWTTAGMWGPACIITGIVTAGKSWDALERWTGRGLS